MMLLVALTAFTIITVIGLYSLMVADAVKHFSHTMIMLWLLQRQLGGLRGFRIGTTIWKALAASVVTGLVAYFVGETAVAWLPLAGFIGKLSIVGVAGGFGLLAFLVLVRLLSITEVQILHRTLTARLRLRRK